jgi:hypothetical protein
MRYWKITNEEECHNELQYKDGLNIDILPFNPSGDCQSGGIYFASKDISHFLNCGPWIREVFLPKDARVYKNPGFPKKWKADKVILGPRRRWYNVEVLKELIEYGCDTVANYNWIIQFAAQDGHLEIVKFLYSVGCDPTVLNNYTIQLAAENGHVDVVKYLYSVGCDPTDLNNYSIRWAAENGHVDVVKYLYSVGCDPTVFNDLAIRWAAKNGHTEVVKFLESVGCEL